MTTDPQAPLLPLRCEELAAKLGNRYTESAFERLFYTHDLASAPPFLARLVGRTLPDAVARPRDAADVAEIVRYAAGHRMAVVPRGAATTVYWNAVPVRGGLVVDLNGLAGLVDLDEGERIATVLPGTRWEALDAALGRHGYSVLSYPTSAPAATVGGWLNMEGYGIGSLQHGGLADQVVELDAVLPDGQLITVRRDGAEGGRGGGGGHGGGGHGGPPLRPGDFARSEGTLGIVTRLRLRVRGKPEAMGHHLLACPDMAALQGLLTALASVPVRPFHAHFADASFGQWMSEAGFSQSSGEGGHADDVPIIALTYQGTAGEVAAGERAVRSAAGVWRAVSLPAPLAARAWEERFYALRIKRTGPTVLGSESWLPLDRIAAYTADVARLAARHRLRIAAYGTAVSGGAPGWATVMSLFPCDERFQARYILALSLTRQLYRIAFWHGGRPYGIGVWNTPYLSRAFSRAELAERRGVKRRLDPADMMNPGKLYAPPLLLSPALFGPGMAALALVSRFV